MVELNWIAGPDTGRQLTLGRGRFTIGRVTGWDDRLVEPHHVMVEVGDTITITQLAGRIPLMVNDELVRGTQPITSGDEIVVGASRLAVGPSRSRPRLGRLVVSLPSVTVPESELVRRVDSALVSARDRVLDPTAVVVGIGPVRHRVIVVDQRGQVIAPGRLPINHQSRLDRLSIVDSEITVPLGRGDVIAVSADDPWPLLRSLIGQFAHPGGATVRWHLDELSSDDVVSAAQLTDLISSSPDRELIVYDQTAWEHRSTTPVSPVIVIGDANTSVTGATHQIEIGSRWMATVTGADLSATAHAIGWSWSQLRSHNPQISSTTSDNAVRR